LVTGDDVTAAAAAAISLKCLSINSFNIITGDPPLPALPLGSAALVVFTLLFLNADSSVDISDMSLKDDTGFTAVVVEGPGTLVQGVPGMVVEGPGMLVEDPVLVLLAIGPPVSRLVHGPGTVVEGPCMVVEDPGAFVQGPGTVVEGPVLVLLAIGPPISRLVQGPAVVLEGPDMVVEGPGMAAGPEVSFLPVSLKTGAVAVRCTPTF